MKEMRNNEREGERGVALIAALLVMTLLMGLGIALVSSATTDTTTTRVQRAGEQSFFAADAGIGIARSSLSQALAEEIQKIRDGQSPYYSNPSPSGQNQFPRVQVVPTPDGTWNNAFYQRVRDRAIQLATATSRAQRFTELNGSSFTVTYQPLTGSVTLVPSDASSAVEVVVLRYAIAVTGKTESGGSATVNETGRLSTNINLTSSGGDANRNFAFSGFGAFFDDGDTSASTALAAGTFTGPVHTNTHFSFASNRNVVFRNVVSQVDSQIRYDSWSSTTPNRNIPNTDIQGIDISSDGFRQVSRVALPGNNFSQEFAVINATGITDIGADGRPVDLPAAIPKNIAGIELPILNPQGRVTVDALAANLRNASNAKPSILSGLLGNGVYVSSGDGTTITGGGIYVQGNASDIQLYADTNGDQVIVIQQGSTTTTIRSSYANNRTTISSGTGSTTYTGTFIDKGDPTSPKPGMLLFVNGAISSLRGGKSGSTNRPAVAPGTAMTITAQRDITITGDLKYANPVANSDGTPVSNLNSIKNVLGIFTNDGNVNLAPNLSYVSGPGHGLEINAAIVSFNSNTLNDGGRIEGSIVYTGGSSPGNNDRWKLVGSRVQSKINNIGYGNRDIYFDVRFSGGKFAPPFFPGTTYELEDEPPPDTVAISSVDSPAPTAMSWFRRNN
jgi:hypothetical protein